MVSPLLCSSLRTLSKQSVRLILWLPRRTVLHILCTLPGYQGKGIGSMLVKWGCDQADRDGVEAYLVAALPAISLYKRFGFESVEAETLPEGYVRTYMVRPRKQVGEEG